MIVLTRSDPERNMRRFYAVDVLPTLFGDWSLVKEWGRIGQAGTVRTAVFPSEASARAALADTLARKTARGYHVRTVPTSARIRPKTTCSSS